MAEKRNETFTVTDRRPFTAEGDLRKDAPEEPQTPVEIPEPAVQASSEAPAPEPPGPTAAEQQQQADAYRTLSAEIDRQVEQSGQTAKDMEITFERFLASIYMTGMLQLGLMREQGAPPQLDLIGARQTIDSLSLLSEKTMGNLNPTERNFLQNALYELRMAYVEVTNVIAQGPPPVPAEK